MCHVSPQSMNECRNCYTTKWRFLLFIYVTKEKMKSASEARKESDQQEKN